jgi:tetratricopeptide (TPR) repeat protein
VQDAAYDSLLKSKRQALHAHIAAAIRERFPGKAQSEPELLAHHYGEAGLLEEAVIYWQKAGELARERFALQEAVSSFRQAVQLLAALDATPAHMQRHIEIAIQWADLIVPSGDVISALETAERYAEQLGEITNLAKVASYLGQLLFYLCQPESAAKRLGRVIEMADRLDDKDRVGSAYRCLGQLYLFAYARCSEALRCIHAALPIVQSSGNRFEESCCRGLLGLEHGFLGQFEESFAAFDDAMSTARTGEERSIECWNLFWRANIQSLKGDWRAAAATANAGIVLAQKIQNVWAVNWCTVVSCHAEFVDHNDISLVERASEALKGIAATTGVCNAACYLAEMLYGIGQLDEANATADRALSELHYGRYFSVEVRAHRIKALVAGRRAPPDWRAAADHMEQASSIARAQRRQPDLAICHLREAQLLLAQGAHEAARSSLDHAEQAFAGMGMTWWLREAARLRGEMG